MVDKIFFDTNPLIYFLNKTEPYFSKVRNFLIEKKLDNAEFYTSTITDAEFLYKPLLEKKFDSINNYNAFLKDLNFLKCYINEWIAKRSADLRVKYSGLKLADSLQLATSIESGCNIFFTNDVRLKQVSEAGVLYLGDL